MTVVKAVHWKSEKANADVEPHEGILLNFTEPNASSISCNFVAVFIWIDRMYTVNSS